MSANPINIIVLTEGKAGHLSQSMGIAELIDCEKDIRVVNVDIELGADESLLRGLTGFHALLGFPSLQNLWQRAMRFLSDEDINFLNDTNPDIVISAGTIPASFNIIIKRKFKCRNVVAMKPSMLPLSEFDLAILPKHDINNDEPFNVISTHTSPNSCHPELIKRDGDTFADEYNINRDDNYWALFLGGPSKVRNFPVSDVISIVRLIAKAANQKNAKLLISTSRRTEIDFENELKELADEYRGQIAFLQIYSEMPISTTRAILALSKRVFITEDSVSMVSESLWAKRETVLIELPYKTMNKVDKIDRFKQNLLENGLISVIGKDTMETANLDTLTGSVSSTDLDDIENIRKSVNALVQKDVSFS